MARIHLDFAQPRRPAGIAQGLLFVLGIAALAAALAWERYDWQPRRAAGEQQLRTLQKALAARQPAALHIDDAQLAAEWQRATGVAGELNRPWEKLFATLENGTAQEVGILSLEPDAAKGELVLTAEARNFAAMLAYYRMLQAQDHLAGVTLHTHQINKQDKEKPVRFRVTAKWGTPS